ncbi:RNA-directed DNA polymerase [Gossypium australe]|uniref:RNA-directed DNA polymerase n=1 Tax=Gossypium australe TaxID=47621 RepID=A0A5B6V6N2_9ROSI|nr:RNA-directed DNA polymerase [Gossypium australe]
MGIRAAIDCKVKVLENKMADALATLASMIRVNEQEGMKPIQMSIYEAPAHCCNIDEEEERDGHPWYHDILRYVKNREILYKKRKDQVLLRCVDAVEARKILEEVHEGVYGTHANGFTMARQIMRFGYYWSMMEGDCICYAKKCHKCQIYGDKIHVPPSPLHVMTSPWPFSMWGIDVIGLISPKASNGHRFIFVVIDYFTKWVEAASYANVTKTAVSKFLKKEIICRYGMPERIVSDNALNLNNSVIEEVCSQFNIKHHNSSPYRSKMNGAVEAANKNIKKFVGKMIETYKDWYEKLPLDLYAYRTSVRISNGATPFSLVYGIETALPIEVEIPSLRFLLELKLDEAEWVQSRYDQLNLIEEKRLRAICHGQMYQKRMMRAYNKKVHPRVFHEGDLVLKKILPMQKDFRGKWMPNWEGHYIVKKAFFGGALILVEMDGRSLPNPINDDSVKKSPKHMLNLECSSRSSYREAQAVISGAPIPLLLILYLRKIYSPLEVSTEQKGIRQGYHLNKWRHRPREINSTGVEQIENHKSYLHVSAMEQTEGYSLISPKQERSRLIIADLISTEQEWSR